MSHDILKKYMMSFSMESLKGFLGEDLIESLLEWHEGTEPFLTKAKCIDMILCIYGTSILKNRNFRVQLLKVLPKDKLLEISAYLPDGYSDSADPSFSDVVASFEGLKGTPPTSWFRPMSMDHTSLDHVQFTNCFLEDCILEQCTTTFVSVSKCQTGHSDFAILESDTQEQQI